MRKKILEVCVDSVESALAAKAGGADRIELCGNLIIGGTTPDPNLFKQIRKCCDIPIHVLIRPRFGDFYYTDHEFEIIREDVRMFRELGADGVVIGVLTPGGALDKKRMQVLVGEAGDMSVTLHRAFDVCADPFQAMEDAVKLKIDTILTSGQENSCLKGMELLEKLEECSEGKIDIMAGSGVDAEVIKKFRKKTNIFSFHMSGKITKSSLMHYRKKGVNMGLESLSEYEIWQTDESKVREAREILDEIYEDSLLTKK